MTTSYSTVKRLISDLYIYKINDPKGKIIIITDQDETILYLFPPLYLKMLIGKNIKEIHGRWKANLEYVQAVEV